jgi:type IV secretion system protein VirB11
MHLVPEPGGERPAAAAAATTMTVAERHEAMMARHLGPAVMRAFADADVTEIYLNPGDGGIVRLDTHARGRVVLDGPRLDAHRVEMFLNAVAARLGATLGPDRPCLEAELPAEPFGGGRLQGFVPPVVPAPAFVVRKPSTVARTLDDYVAAGVLTAVQCRALREAVGARRNVLVVGGTNSGKTTLANALLAEITARCPGERVVILEDTVELRSAAPDTLALRTTAGVTLADLVRATMRTSPNRIVVGEVRGAEALDLLDAWATGHPGGVATLHATSAEGALLRLGRLACRANVPPQHALIAEAIHLVAVVEGGNAAGRRVADVVRVDGLDPTAAADAPRYVLHRLDDAGEWT